jgi:hypothetical protein
MTVYANANFGGPLASANNLQGINAIPVALLNTTAKVWTHSFGRTPVAILPFVNADANGGAPMPALNTCIVTSNNNAITLTPVASVNVTLLVIWSLPIGSQNGVPTTNFV